MNLPLNYCQWLSIVNHNIQNIRSIVCAFYKSFIVSVSGARRVQDKYIPIQFKRKIAIPHIYHTIHVKFPSACCCRLYCFAFWTRESICRKRIMTSTDEDDIFDAADQLADSGLYGSNQRYYQMLLENNYVSDLSKVIFKDNITSNTNIMLSIWMILTVQMDSPPQWCIKYIAQICCCSLVILLTCCEIRIDRRMR